MARNIRWDESVLENAIALLDALLQLVEQQSEDVKAPLVVRWENNRLRVTGFETKQTNGKRSRIVEVGTKKEHLLSQIKAADKSLKCPKNKELEEIKTVLYLFLELEVRQDEESAKNKGYWKFTLALKHQTASNTQNLEVVKQKWREHPKTTSQKNSITTESTNTSINWHNICGEMLVKYKRLTTNELLFADEDMKFQFDDIHVPLALVQRTKTEKRQENILPEFGSHLLQPAEYEEKQKFEYDDFLEKVLKQGNGKTQGKRVALIGEPGAGKTTLLQAIASWILENNLGLPIWISLADLQMQDGRLKDFGDYLRESWLWKAIANLTPAIKTEFTKQFEFGQVWLLLDGVDEITMSNNSPLQAISFQLQGWMAKSRVVLTCRLNIWEANLNALEDFETYRLLDFNYPSQVKQFTNNWFKPRNSTAMSNKAEELWQVLNKPESKRIQDLVKNPLRLALLCATWQSSEKGLPDTKAGLYHLFVKHFYNWKSNRFRTTDKQPITDKRRRELNTALGNLAKIAIDGKTSRFRLHHDLVSSVLGDVDEKDSLFCLALQLGWLNKVGIAAESDIREDVYAFYHPTFQEYFAALAIDDKENYWEFFLPIEHKDRPIEDKDKPGQYRRYRIFDPQWKEVILLWLGRDKNQISDTQKEDFIKVLIKFSDGCGDINFYGFQAYFLAAAGIAQYKNCSKADEIIAKIIRWGIGYFDSEQQQWFSCLKEIADVAKKALYETDIQRKTDVLVRMIQDSQNKYIFW